MPKQTHQKKEPNSYVVVVRFAPSLIARLDAMAAEEGITRSAIVRRAVIQRYAPAKKKVA